MHFSDYEIIVVDDDSADDTLGMIEELDVPVNFKYLFWGRKERFIPGEPMNRVGPVRNLGVKFAKGDIVVFFDSDIIPNPKALHEHYKSHTTERDIVVGPSILETTGYDVREGYFRTCDDDPMKFSVPWTLAHEGNISFNRKKFISAGGFSSDFIYWGFEGDDLAYRMLQSDAIINLSRAAFGVHQSHPKEYVDPHKWKIGHKYHVDVMYKKYLDKNILLRQKSDVDHNIWSYFRTGHDDENKVLYVSKNCNNNCSFCNVLKKKSDNNISLSEIKKMDFTNVKRIYVAGGEPMLNKEIFDIFSFLKKKSIPVTLITNGRIFSYEKYAKKIINYVNDYVFKIFSVNNNYDKITNVKEGYEQFVLGVKNISKQGGNISFDLILNEDNYKNLDQILKFVVDCHANHLDVVILRPLLGINENKVDYFMKIISILSEFNDKVNIDIHYDFFSCIPDEVRGDIAALSSKSFINKDFIVGNVQRCQKCECITNCKSMFVCENKMESEPKLLCDGDCWDTGLDVLHDRKKIKRILMDNRDKIYDILHDKGVASKLIPDRTLYLVSFLYDLIDSVLLSKNIRAAYKRFHYVYFNITPREFDTSVDVLKELGIVGTDDVYEVVIRRDNYQQLAKYVSDIPKGKNLKFIFPEPVLGEEKEFYDKYPTIEKLHPYILKARDIAEQKGVNIIENLMEYKWKKSPDLLNGFNDVLVDFVLNQKNTQPKISVIIPVSNRKELLLNTLESLNNQNFDSDKYEVIIVDDGGNDGLGNSLKEMKYKYCLKYLYWPRLSNIVEASNRAGPVRNLGAKFADGKILLFLDSDIEASFDLLKMHYNIHNEGSKNVVFGPCFNSKENDPREPFFRMCNNDISKYPVPWELAYEGNISYLKKDFDRFGGFGKDYVYWAYEGDEIAFKCFLEGFNFVYLKDAFGIHQEHDKETNSGYDVLSGEKYNAEIMYKKFLHPDIYDWYYRMFTDKPVLEKIQCKDGELDHKEIVIEDPEITEFRDYYKFFIDKKKEIKEGGYNKVVNNAKICLNFFDMKHDRSTNIRQLDQCQQCYFFKECCGRMFFHMNKNGTVNF